MYNTEIFIEHNGKPHFHYATTRVLTDAEIEKVKKTGFIGVCKKCCTVKILRRHERIG